MRAFPIRMWPIRSPPPAAISQLSPIEMLRPRRQVEIPAGNHVRREASDDPHLRAAGHMDVVLDPHGRMHDGARAECKRHAVDPDLADTLVDVEDLLLRVVDMARGMTRM